MNCPSFVSSHVLTSNLPHADIENTSPSRKISNDGCEVHCSNMEFIVSAVGIIDSFACYFQRLILLKEVTRLSSGAEVENARPLSMHESLH